MDLTDGFFDQEISFFRHACLLKWPYLTRVQDFYIRCREFFSPLLSTLIILAKSKGTYFLFMKYNPF